MSPPDDQAHLFSVPAGQPHRFRTTDDDKDAAQCGSVRMSADGLF
jgi:hypothetical protein